MTSPASDPSPAPPTVEGEIGEVRLRCVCGSVARGAGDGHRRETDARVECDNCGCLYVVTVTRVSGPADE